MPSENAIVHVIDDDEASRQSLAFLLQTARMEVQTYASAAVFLDLLPDTWTGPPPGLPQDVVEDLARRAREAEQKLRKQQLRLRQRQLPLTRVRVAHQPTFSRYIFDLPELISVSTARAKDALTLVFDAPLAGIADPARTPNPAKAPWFFLGVQELLRYYAPVVAGVLFPALSIVALAVIRWTGRQWIDPVVGLGVDQIRAVLQSSGFDRIDVANLNSPQQSVISGLKEDVAEVGQAFEKAGAKMFVPLEVSAAFHSRYMRPAQTEFEAFVRGFTFTAPSIPVIANVSARPYGPDDVASNICRQITSPVRWVESMQYLLLQHPDAEFEEIGPGLVLTGLLRQARAASKP